MADMADNGSNGPGALIDDGNQGNEAKMFIGGLNKNKINLTINLILKDFPGKLPKTRSGLILNSLAK